jgi:hypothetical protein
MNKMTDLTLLKQRALEALPDVLPSHWTTPDGAEMAREYGSKPRSWLGMSDLSDFALANAVFMADRNDLNLIIYQTAAKERIRWLSAQLALALADMEALKGENPEELTKAEWIDLAGKLEDRALDAEARATALEEIVREAVANYDDGRSSYDLELDWITRARSALSNLTASTAGGGSSCTDSGSSPPAAAKSDGLCKSEGGDHGRG